MVQVELKKRKHIQKIRKLSFLMILETFIEKYSKYVGIRVRLNLQWKTIQKNVFQRGKFISEYIGNSIYSLSAIFPLDLNGFKTSLWSRMSLMESLNKSTFFRKNLSFNDLLFSFGEGRKGEMGELKSWLVTNREHPFWTVSC